MEREAWPVGLFRSKLVERRRRLQKAVDRSGLSARLGSLLQEVDSALLELERGSYGLCQACGEPIERERLLADPFLCFCLDHLTPRQRRDLESDLELAAQVQEKLLPPRYLCQQGWEVTYHFDPAGPVSGDYCDLVESGSSLYFFLGDVSGKGVAASLLMSQLHAIFRSLIPLKASLARLMSQANRLFCESTLSAHYATLVSGRLRASGQVELVNAGHWPVLLLDSSRTLTVEATAPPIGLFCSEAYPSRRFRLGEGDTLVLYTDGVPEAVNGAGRDYGAERLRELLSLHPERSIHDLIGLFRCDFEGFRSEKRDDVTLMVVRRRSQSPAGHP